MEYTLMHRKLPVALIEIDEETGAISGLGEVFNPRHIPVGISVNEQGPNRGDLNDWWHGRSIPASRQNIHKAMKVLGVSSADKLLTKCFGLSLSDQYWVNPSNSPLDWEEVNFFDRPFSEDVGDILFDNWAKGRRINLISPDNTSDGWLKKKWQIIKGRRYLLKGGSDPFWQQPLNEAMASSIMRRLNIPHVPYSLIWDEGLPYSICENFLTSETELVSAYYIHNTKKIQDADDLYGHYLDCCLTLGIPHARMSLEKMLVADYLIANQDRHLNNFGAVRDAESLEWLRPAPLFDNGSSLWYNQVNIAAAQSKSQPFLHTHEEQLKLVSDFSWLNLEDLAGIDEEFNDLLRLSPLIDAPRRDALCFALRARAAGLACYTAS